VGVPGDRRFVRDDVRVGHRSAVMSPPGELRPDGESLISGCTVSGGHGPASARGSTNNGLTRATTRDAARFEHRPVTG
jgi:hypothetical protein